MKKNIIIDNLTLNQEVISILDDSPMMYVVDTNGGIANEMEKPKSVKPGCRYSRNHVTKCERASHTVDGNGKHCTER